MGIEPWWAYNPKYDDKEETCTECGGTGMDNVSLDHKCYHCMGTGVEPKRDDK